MDVALINCRAVKKNGHKVKDYVVEKDCDITAITETWLPEDELIASHRVKDLCPKGYKMPHRPHATGHRGGGIGLLHKVGMNIKPQETETIE